MSQRTCSVEGCAGAHKARGWCGKHYQRWQRHGDPLRLERVVLESCRVAECDRVPFGYGYCQKHWYRYVNTGDPHVLPSGQAPRGTHKACVVAGCPNPPRGGWGMCTTHRLNHQATGDPLQRPGPRVKGRPCAKCGEFIDYTARDEAGRYLISSAARVCRGCRRESGLTRYIPELIERDGDRCHICSRQVGVSLKYPDPESPSVDHFIPRAAGGADDVSNYRVVHLRCNVLKHTKVGFVLTE